MNILIVDDLQTRHDIVEEILGKTHTIFHAFSVFDAIDIMEQSSNRIGLCLMSFDTQTFSTSEEGDQVEKTGIDLIEYIDCHFDESKYPAIAYVHSHDERAKEMVEDLKELGVFAQHRPFSSLMIKAILREFQEQ
jgi:PleD family two-component response regulator